MATVLFCLALTVFQEARGEPLMGQRAVATVVLNRSRIRNLDTCEVLLERGQFSWKPERYIQKVRVKSGKGYRFVKTGLPVGSKAWKNAEKAAKLAYFSSDSMQNAEFFHAKYVNPGWHRRYSPVFTVGNHVFYARNSRISGRKMA